MTHTFLGKVGELMLKGSNIKTFERQLVKNTQAYLAGTNAKVRLNSGRLYIECDDENVERAKFALSHLIGITGWAETAAVEKDIEAIKKEVYEEALRAKENGAKTFKLESRRSDKTFPYDHYGICSEGAEYVCRDNILEVNVKNPDVVIMVEVRDKCYVYSDRIKGCRGLPVGVSGKGLLLLSGGLDSPVAGYRMMRRGMTVDSCYFHAYPYTSDEAREKVEHLAQILSCYGIRTHINIIPFTEVQMEIKKKSPESYTTLMLRLCMMKCANLLAKRTGAQCIITGESLGQVASQTIENMSCTESMAEFPLLRPLVGMDKEEIVDTAKEIGTYETSILPYEDCCVLFSPRHPVLRSTVEEAQEIYRNLGVDELIQKAFDERVIKRFEAGEAADASWIKKEE